MFEGFHSIELPGAGVRLHARVGGAGPPLLLLHGHPQTSAMWHHVAPALAERFSVVALDLRGYGASERVPADAEHAAHSKRVMAADALAAMRALGHERFAVLAHDRGARVAHRLALDHPHAVRRMMLLDIAPTLAMYSHTSASFAREYWHWFFLIQPAPLPERLIEADPAAYVREVMGRRPGGLALFDPAALAEYERCVAAPGSASSICEDYRAAAGIDLHHHRADRSEGRRLTQPLRVLWGARGTVGRLFDVPALWHDDAESFSGRALDSGHYIAEEAPILLLAEALTFFEEPDS
jgi:haloacetate dehalogenase